MLYEVNGFLGYPALMGLYAADKLAEATKGLQVVKSGLSFLGSCYTQDSYLYMFAAAERCSAGGLQYAVLHTPYFLEVRISFDEPLSTMTRPLRGAALRGTYTHLLRKRLLFTTCSSLLAPHEPFNHFLFDRGHLALSSDDAVFDALLVPAYLGTVHTVAGGDGSLTALYVRELSSLSAALFVDSILVLDRDAGAGAEAGAEAGAGTDAPHTPRARLLCITNMHMTGYQPLGRFLETVSAKTGTGKRLLLVQSDGSDYFASLYSDIADNGYTLETSLAAPVDVAVCFAAGLAGLAGPPGPGALRPEGGAVAARPTVRPSATVAGLLCNSLGVAPQAAASLASAVLSAAGAFSSARAASSVHADTSSPTSSTASLPGAAAQDARASVRDKDNEYTVPRLYGALFTTQASSQGYFRSHPTSRLLARCRTGAFVSSLFALSRPVTGVRTVAIPATHFLLPLTVSCLVRDAGAGGRPGSADRFLFRKVVLCRSDVCAAVGKPCVLVLDPYCNDYETSFIEVVQPSLRPGSGEYVADLQVFEESHAFFRLQHVHTHAHTASENALLVPRKAFLLGGAGQRLLFPCHLYSLCACLRASLEPYTHYRNQELPSTSITRTLLACLPALLRSPTPATFGSEQALRLAALRNLFALRNSREAFPIDYVLPNLVYLELRRLMLVHVQGEVAHFLAGAEAMDKGAQRAVRARIAAALDLTPDDAVLQRCTSLLDARVVGLVCAVAHGLRPFVMLQPWVQSTAGLAGRWPFEVLEQGLRPQACLSRLFTDSFRDAALLYNPPQPRVFVAKTAAATAAAPLQASKYERFSVFRTDLEHTGKDHLVVTRNSWCQKCSIKGRTVRACGRCHTILCTKCCQFRPGPIAELFDDGANAALCEECSAYERRLTAVLAVLRSADADALDRRRAEQLFRAVVGAFLHKRIPAAEESDSPKTDPQPAASYVSESVLCEGSDAGPPAPQASLPLSSPQPPSPEAGTPSVPPGGGPAKEGVDLALWLRSAEYIVSTTCSGAHLDEEARPLFPLADALAMQPAVSWLFARGGSSLLFASGALCNGDAVAIGSPDRQGQQHQPRQQLTFPAVALTGSYSSMVVDLTPCRCAAAHAHAWDAGAILQDIKLMVFAADGSRTLSKHYGRVNLLSDTLQSLNTFDFAAGLSNCALTPADCRRFLTRHGSFCFVATLPGPAASCWQVFLDVPRDGFFAGEWRADLTFATASVGPPLGEGAAAPAAPATAPRLHPVRHEREPVVLPFEYAEERVLQGSRLFVPDTFERIFRPQLAGKASPYKTLIFVKLVEPRLSFLRISADLGEDPAAVHVYALGAHDTEDRKKLRIIKERLEQTHCECPILGCHSLEVRRLYTDSNAAARRRAEVPPCRPLQVYTLALHPAVTNARRLVVCGRFSFSLEDMYT